MPISTGLRPWFLVLALLVALAGTALALLVHPSSAGAACVNDRAGAPVRACGGGLPQSTSFTFQPSSRALSAILCTVSIDNPHPSSHVGGTVNVVSHINCSPGSLMALLSLDTELWRSGGRVASGHSQIAGFYWLDNNAAVGCVSGGYVGNATARLTPPPGYTPASASATVTSPLVTIAC
jgi:hypothetical protein